MRKNPVKRTLQQGGVSLGTFALEFATNGLSRAAGVAGAEFIIFDMEHTGWSVETIGRLCATTPPDGPVPLVRVPAFEYHWIARVLDVGAMGLMFPMVESPEQARTIVSSAKYPPRGRRGAAFGLAHDDYNGSDIGRSMLSADEETLLIAQIETRAGLEAVEDIAAVPGIDCLWIGQFDLTNSLGIPGQFDHPLFVEGLQRVLQACAAHRKTAGFLATDVPTARAMLARGFRLLAFGGDVWLYQQALRDGLDALRKKLPGSEPPL